MTEISENAATGTNEGDYSFSVQMPIGQLVFAPNYGVGTVTQPLRLNEMATVTVTTDVEDVAAEEPLPTTWRAILGFEGYPADGDMGRKRYLMPGGLSERQLPLPFSIQRVSDEGHKGKETAGRIDTIEWVSASDFAQEGFELPEDLPKDATVVFGTGIWDLQGEPGREAARLVAGKFMRGVSLDLAGTVWVPIDPQTFEEINPDDMSLEDMLVGDFLAGAKEAQIAGATIVSESAFGHAMVAHGGEFDFVQILNVYDPAVLVACAAGPLKPPSAFFEKMSFRRKTPITTSDDGEFWGHLATWDCHMGDDVRCFRARPSNNGYANFHTGTIVTEEGEHVKVGRITVKEHASFGATRDEVMAHYSDPKKVGAFVRIWDDEFGIACHGVTRSDASPELLRDLYANPPSPDWRRGELLGVSTVPLPGLPVVDPQAVLVASADGIPEVDVLILPPLGPEDFVEPLDETAVMVAAATIQGDEALLGLIAGDEEPTYLDDFKTYTTAQRKRYAKSGVAMDDGSFPIEDCAAAERAIHAQGRSNKPAANVRKHISKRVRALGCSGGIFDNYK